MAKKGFTLGLREDTELKFKDPPEIGPEPDLANPEAMAIAFDSIRWALEKHCKDIK